VHRTGTLGLTVADWQPSTQEAVTKSKTFPTSLAKPSLLTQGPVDTFSVPVQHTIVPAQCPVLCQPLSSCLHSLNTKVYAGIPDAVLYHTSRMQNWGGTHCLTQFTTTSTPAIFTFQHTTPPTGNGPLASVCALAGHMASLPTMRSGQWQPQYQSVAPSGEVPGHKPLPSLICSRRPSQASSRRSRTVSKPACPP
jgi:hypothetical protein